MYHITVIRTAIIFLFLLLFSCSMKRYSRPQLEAFTKISYTPKYKELAEPLVVELSVVLKEIFFLKHDVAAMKDKLWDGGSNHRIMKINDDIDILKSEISRLKLIRREILSAINTIMPGFKEPLVIGYKGGKEKYERLEKMNRPIILASLNDQNTYNAAKYRGEKLSAEQSYRKTISVAMSTYKSIESKRQKRLNPIGAKGPVKKITRKSQ